MYVCVYMLVRVFLCVCACIHASVRVRAFLCVCKCARTYVRACLCIRKRLHVCASVCRSVCVCLCVHVHAHGVRRALQSPESESQCLSLARRQNIDALAAQMGKLQRARPGNTP